ncbi:type VI secretion system membrane subunit TssM [soil metagenome]
MNRYVSGGWHGVLRAALGVLAVLAISAVLWWIGPLISIAGVAPLEPVAMRVVLVATLWIGCIARLLFKLWRARRANAMLMDGISAPSAADHEANVLSQRFREAVAKLKAAPGGKSRFGSSVSLYELPWYVFVGAPGSGKTTALLNAGLQFVLADDGAAVKGVGGTRHCDWWFTRDAVLIDTAGRYALQESDRAVDSAAWNNFLALLRKTRPRRPINGVLLTVSVQDLLQRGEVERAEHAAKLRTRLDELQARLGVRPPVYVIVTKADLIAGFAETFEALGKTEREQVWGFTFDAKADAADTSLGRVAVEYRALLTRLVEGLNDRLQSERDGTRRTAMFGFPQEFASLQPVLEEFLGHVFGGAGSLQEPVRLRGVYFTSGTQEGSPIDRAMGQLARSFGLERKLVPPPGQRGKSFFLRQLLQDVVFREAHLVSSNPKAERRRLVARVAGFATVAVASVALSGGWGASYLRNKSYVHAVDAALPALKQAVDALPPSTHGDPASVAATLDAVRDAAAAPKSFAIDSPPLLDSLGLYQGGKLDAAAQQAYRKLLAHAMFPRVAQRIEERLRAANRDNLEQAYEALKAYVMLYTPDRFDADALKAWVAIDWDAQLTRLTPPEREALDRHLDAMLALGAPQHASPQDTALVSSVRDMLASYPLEYRVYSHLKRRLRDAAPEFSVAAAGGPNAPKVFERASGLPLSRGVSGFYTRDGYLKAFQGTVNQAATRLAGEEQWVLGSKRSASDIARLAVGGEIGNRVRRLYLQDYVKAWDDFIADVRLIGVDSADGSMDASVEVARLLSGVDSPLNAYLRAVARETTLVEPPAQANVLTTATASAMRAKDELTRIVDPQSAVPAGAAPIERIVDDHFAPLHRMLKGTPAPIDEVPKMFGEVYAQLQAISSARRAKSAPPAAISGGTFAAAGQQPQPIRSMLENLAQAGSRQGRAAERDSMTGDLKPIFDFCTRAVANRYPFAPSSKADVMPEDFGQLFGGGGMLDEFYLKRLAAMVDTSGSAWAYKPLADGVKPATPAALAEFQRAASIREVFFRNGGRAPSFRIDIRAVEFIGGLEGMNLDIDGQVHKFVPDGGAPLTVTWPGQRVASQLTVSAANGSGKQTFDGPWALFRLFDRFEVTPSAQPEKFSVLVNLEGKRARLEVTANSVFNPFRMREMLQFRCPGAL